VIAPILGNGHGEESNVKSGAATECCTDDKEKDACCETEGEAKKNVTSSAKMCDMSECSKMTKEECAAMCADKGCSEEETAACLAKYDDEGNWKGTSED
jgi:K(+)-stimulated pyrophosphate-energized sodium pump